LEKGNCAMSLLSLYGRLLSTLTKNDVVTIISFTRMRYIDHQ
jgi:hypothetical protein